MQFASSGLATLKLFQKSWNGNRGCHIRSKAHGNDVVRAEAELRGMSIREPSSLSHANHTLAWHSLRERYCMRKYSFTAMIMILDRSRRAESLRSGSTFRRRRSMLSAYATDGLEVALFQNRRLTLPVAAKLTDDLEAKAIAIAVTKAPPSHKCWTTRLRTVHGTQLRCGDLAYQHRVCSGQKRAIPAPQRVLLHSQTAGCSICR